MKVLLDANAYSFMREGHPAVTRKVASASEIIFSTVVAGELLHGFYKGSRLDANRRRLDDFLEQPGVTVLPVTMVTADRFGRIMTALSAKGRPIPVNDIWIAAHVFEAGAELVTFDRHFLEVDGLFVTVLE